MHVYDQTPQVVASATFATVAAAAPSGPLVRNANDLTGQIRAVAATAHETQRKVFKNPRGVRHSYALVVVSNPEMPAPGGLPGGLWLFRSTDTGATWAPVDPNPVTGRLKRDNSDPPTVTASLWVHDDGTQLVVYVTYAQGDYSPVWYRRIRIADDGTVTIGPEQDVGARVAAPGSVRPVIARDRAGRVHIAYRRAQGVISLLGTVAPDPDDLPTWLQPPVDLLTTPDAGAEDLPLLLPFSGPGALLGFVAAARAGAYNALHARNISNFDGTAYTLGPVQLLGAVTAGAGRLGFGTSLSGVVDRDGVAHLLYVKDCADCGSAAGVGTGVYSRRAAAAGTVESWGAPVQVTAMPSDGTITTASLSIETSAAADRLYAFFGTNTGVVSFKTTSTGSSAWGASGCTEKGGTPNGAQCDLQVAETSVDWLASPQNGPMQLVWTRLAEKSPVRTLYVDTAAPSVTIAFVPNGANGWFTTSPAPGSVTATDDARVVSLSCTDSRGGLSQGPLSGGGTPTASRSVSVSGDAADHVVTCTAVDGAGNSASASLTVRIDTAPPTVTGSRSPAPNAFGWNNTDVTVTFTCTDALSGVTPGTGPTPVLLSAEGVGQTASGTCADRAGNTATATVGGINIDRTPPVVTFEAPLTVPNAAGWYNADVAVPFVAGDALSGVDTTIPAASPLVISAEGAGVTSDVTVRDRAGNTAVVASPAFNIDKTPPVLSASRSPEPNHNGWNNTDVTVAFTCTDALAGVAQLSPEAPQVLGEGAGQAATGTCTDVAGNTTTAAVTDVNVDKTAPTIAAQRDPAPNAAGWNNTGVTVTFACEDALSGFVESTLPPPRLLLAEGADQSTSGTCIDRAGNTVSLTVTGINIDRTPPVLIFGDATPAPNAAGWHRTDVAVPYSTADTLSGVASTDPAGNPLVLSQEGAAVVGRVTVTDRAGNTATFETPAYRIDKTPPAVTAHADPAPNAQGWNRDDVTVTFAGEDSGAEASGVETCASPVTLTGETPADGTPVRGTCTDRAGNESVPVEVVVKIDRTPPEVRATVTPPANADGWHNTDVTVAFDCTDALSGVRSGSGAQTRSVEGAGQHVIGVCTDNAENAAEALVVLNIDKTPPAAPSQPDLVAASDTGGKDDDDITAHPTPTVVGSAEPGTRVQVFDGEALLGVAVAAPDGAWMLTLGGLTDGVHALAARAVDLAGNASLLSGTLSLTVDTTAPPAPSPPDLLPASDTGLSDSDDITTDDTPTLTGTAEAGAVVLIFDGAAPLGTTAAGPTGAWVFTSGPLALGAHSLSARAVDTAGNVSPASRALDVTIEPVTFLVTLVDGLTEGEQATIIKRNGGVQRQVIAALRLHIVDVPASQVETALTKYQADPQVLSAEVDQTRAAQADPSDLLYPAQWALPRIRWDQVFGNYTPPGTAKVAILDTGVDASHPELAGRVVPGTAIVDGTDDGSQGLTDPNGHGTWLAGIVAALTDNAAGIAGVGYAGVQIVPVRVLNAQGVGQDSDIVAGVVWAADYGADVILMAFSAPGFSQALQYAIDYAWAKGVVVVAATGNGGSSTPTFPAGNRGVVGVTATDENDWLVEGSNYGPAAFLAAPGVQIQTTAAGGGYTSVHGTSPASAIVAGAAALMKAADPALSNGIIVGRLARTADSAGTQEQTGNGRINLARAMADTSTEPVQPAGAQPVGEGGPYVGPYTAAARFFTAAISPTSTNVGAATTYTLTITNTSNAGESMDCVRVTIPAGAGNPANMSVAATDPGPTLRTWSQPTVNAGAIETQRTGAASNSIDPNGTVVVTFTATATTGGTKTWTTSAYGNPNCSSQLFSIQGSQPSVTVSQVVTITASDASAAEAGPDTGTFTVTRTTADPTALTVNYTVGGTATAGSDYAALTGSVTIPANATSAMITVTPVDDAVYEGSQTVVVTLAAGSGYIVGSPSSATVTILDNDAPPVLRIADVTASEGNSGTTGFTFTVTKTGATELDATVAYATAPTGTAPVAASEGTACGSTGTPDYKGASGTLSIPAAAGSGTITVQVCGEEVYERDQTFQVTLSAPVDATIGDGTGQGVIENDDAPPLLRIDDVTADEGDSGTSTLTFTVTRTGATELDATVNYATTSAGATAAAGASCDSNVDYVSASGSITFDASSDTPVMRKFSVTVCPDLVDEDNETLFANLSGTGDFEISDGQGVGTIKDDDDSPVVVANVGSRSTQYTDAIDPVTVTATDADSAGTLLAATTTFAKNGGPSVSGLPAGLSLTLGSTDNKVPGSRSWTLAGAPQVEAGDYVVTIQVSDTTDGGNVGETTVTITVSREDAAVEYTGGTIARVGTSLMLRATVWDSAAASFVGAGVETGGGATIGDVTKM
ncbi:MAG: Ig-like domain-containing protein, partial [Armatimonadota bacterium]|nr:Ig-like domain-containing protein [Armatimonadota bacterium]